MRRVLIIAVVLGLGACTQERETVRFQPGNRTSPKYPGATVIRATVATTANPVAMGGLNDCATWLTDFGTEDSIDEVIAFYEGLGFEGQGEPGGDQGIIRWIGIREGTVKSWRRVDIALGEIGGSPEWNTYFAIETPNCRGQGIPSSGG